MDEISTFVHVDVEVYQSYCYSLQPWDEESLAGGNVAGRVVKVGMTVRKPAGAHTAGVEEFLNFLSARGFRGCPRPLARDDEGRHILEYIPGETIRQPELLSIHDLRQIGKLIRDLHDLAADFSPLSARWNVAIKPDSESMICHNDLGPWNLVRRGDKFVFIDWDGCGPASALWDLAYAAQSFPPLKHGGDPVVDALRLHALVDGYGADKILRQKLPDVIVSRTLAMHQLLAHGAQTGEQPWALLAAQGHADYWGRASRYVGDNLMHWKRALKTT